MLLIEGENADGLTVDEDNFDVAADDESATSTAADQLIAAIRGTRESAVQAGHVLMSTGVTWTEPADTSTGMSACVSTTTGVANSPASTIGSPKPSAREVYNTAAAP